MSMDGSKFNEIDEKWSYFKEDPRNLKLSMAVDGVNPYGEMRSIYLVWPIFVINNNIPLWMSIKRECIMLALIVPGKYQVKDINVSIEPLSDKLMVLWNGVTMYDISRPIGQRQFQFHAMLVWTIHDALGLTHFCGMFSS